MPNEQQPKPSDEPSVTRRESVRRAAALALAAGLGVPPALLGTPGMARMQWKIYKGPTEGGALVESVELSDNLTAFIMSPEASRAQLKWYAPSGQEVLNIAMPKMYGGKI